MKEDLTLRDFRKERHMTQAELGKAIGVDYSTVSRYENNSASPSLEVMVKIQELSGNRVSMRSLLCPQQ